MTDVLYRETQSLAELAIAVEPVIGADGTELASRIGKAVREELLFRPNVSSVAPGSLAKLRSSPGSARKS